MLKNPQFWNHTFGISQALRPISWLYQQASTWREARITPIKVEIPVICVGNIVMGGAGKTPTVMALVEILKSIGHVPHILSRGYGGYLRDTILVNPSEHSYLQVGDEPLLLAQIAPTWIGTDRITSARAAKKAGASIVVMDDGLQNPSLFKDFNLIVIDAIQGFGNQLMFPAGPLREPIKKGLNRADAVVVVGKGNPFKLEVKGQFGARLICSGSKTLEPVVAFAGIGYPKKFRHSLEQNNYIVREFISFADHHPYTITDIQRLLKIAEHHESKLITTSKDLLRIPSDYRDRVNVLPIQLQFDNIGEIRNLLQQRFPV
jgi:tetraacyldisaccharide 4'-kinase